MKYFLLTLILCAGSAVQAQPWVQTNGPVEDNVLDLCIDSNGILYAATPFGVNRSTNGGEHWTRPFLFPSPIQQRAVLCIAANGNIIVAGDSIIYVSTDTANTFTKRYEDQSLDLHPVFNFAVSGSGRIFTGRLHSPVYSDDHGQTWLELKDEETRVEQGTPIAVAASRDTIIMHGHRNTFASYDNGDSWTKLNPSGTNSIYKMCILPNGRWISLDYRSGLSEFSPDHGVWVNYSGQPSDKQFHMAEVLQDGSVLVGTDKGLFQVTPTLDWIDITSGYPFQHLWIRRFVEDHHQNVYYVAISGAGVWKTSHLLKTAVGHQSNTLRLAANPVSDHITLEYHATEPASIAIELSDILGRRVRWQQELAAIGTNTSSIDVRTLLPGNYLLVLRTNERTETQWVTIVK